MTAKPYEQFISDIHAKNSVEIDGQIIPIYSTEFIVKNDAEGRKKAAEDPRYTVYINNRTYVPVVCLRCRRIGRPERLYMSKKQGKKLCSNDDSGCRLCSADKNRKKVADAIAQARAVQSAKGREFGYDLWIDVDDMWKIRENPELVVYPGRSHRVPIICPGCTERNGARTIIWPLMDHHLKGYGCGDCDRASRLNEKTFIEECVKVHGDRYDYAQTEYKGNESPITIFCNVHNKYFTMSRAYNHVILGQGCRECAGKAPYTEEVLHFRCIDHYEGEFTIVEISGLLATDKLIARCKAGHTRKYTIGRFASGGSGCSECVTFKAEERARKVMEILFDDKFPKVRPDFLLNPETGRNLELDGYCEKLKVAFEFQGPQHYDVCGWLGQTVEQFEACQARDELKAKLCEANGITLIEIPHWLSNYRQVRAEIARRIENRLDLVAIFKTNDAEKSAVLSDTFRTPEDKVKKSRKKTSATPKRVAKK